MKQRKEKSEQLLQDLNTLKQQLAPGGSAHLLLEEENYKLHTELKAAKQDIKVQKFTQCLFSRWECHKLKSLVAVNFCHTEYASLLYIYFYSQSERKDKLLPVMGFTLTVCFLYPNKCQFTNVYKMHPNFSEV